jgi:16S rRNA (guanine527-N7)-methyltransferase
MPSLIEKYFPGLSVNQLGQFARLQQLYEEWNARINVISRKDIGSLEEKHVLHSLGIAKVISFGPSTRILDIGTGGGFPGIPLAIMFPQASFMLVDSIGKKIKVVEAVASALGLPNVTAQQARAESLGEKFDFVVTRAVTEFPELVRWTKGKITPGESGGFRHGIIALKGGDLQQEMGSMYAKAEITPLSRFFHEEFFETKMVVYLPA